MSLKLFDLTGRRALVTGSSQGIGFALARGPADIALVFGALGLGMAAPFLAVAAAPELTAWLPRPGKWMDWLRHGLGLALLGTAVWLLFVLALEAGSDNALLAGGMLAALLAVLAAAEEYRGELAVGDIPIRVEEVSDDTDQANAYAYGIGPSRRIVFWDTMLLDPFDEE